MKILWMTNKILPAIERSIGESPSTVNEGWTEQMFSRLIDDERIEMNIICMGGKADNTGKTNNFTWYTFKESYRDITNYSNSLMLKIKVILSTVRPDIIHIWGTEYPHTLALVNSAEKIGMIDKVVISLQGVIYAISQHYLTGIPSSAINKKTIYDIIRKNSLNDQRNKLIKRGKYEIESFMKVKHVIGRTLWDKVVSSRINSNLLYHHCNETLREVFYSKEWSYSNCQQHSIFISQASTPIKGFHIFLKSLPQLIKRYPDIQVFVAGINPTRSDSLMSTIKLSSYGKLLRETITKLGVEKHITFLGRLDSEKMCDYYLRANVFVSASTIENSPNSVGEAMLLGCPIVCSDVGGVRSILSSPYEGFTYPVEEYYMIAYYVSQIFDNPLLSENMGKKAKIHAIDNHNPIKNYSNLLDIYSSIAKLELV